VAIPSDNYDVLMQQYLESARMSQPTAAVADSSWMTGLFGDLRARRVNDLVTINVIETLSAVGSADSSLDKDSSASAAVASLFGVESKLPKVIDPSAWRR
jgi:flagellar basal body L-ring protein FlgH